MNLAPVTLIGDVVRLEPLTREHHDGLVQAVRDGELWKLWYTSVPAPEDMTADIGRRLALQADGSMVPFVSRLTGSGRIAGSTTYCHIDADNRRLEIGYTFTAASLQRTGLNTESKLLLLRHAFEELDCIAVEFRTHWHNQQSRAAIERLGAKQDGVLRSHSLGRDESLRDTVVFSIVAAEWPAVRSGLLHRLAQHA